MRSGRTHRLKRSDVALLKEVKQRILDHVPDAKVFLYGSVARGEATPESDYDVLVITPRRLTRPEEDAIYDATYEVDLARDALTSVVFFSQEDWDAPLTKASPFYRNVVRESVSL